MGIKDFIDGFTAELSSLKWYDSREIKTMATYLLREIASIEPYKIIVSPELELEPEAMRILLQITGQMSEGCPMQYALGYEYFCGHKFNVKEGVLIPRPETEELVGLIAGEAISASGTQGNTASGQMKILDICTGSGCIAWSLAAALPKSRVWGCDISDEALEIARSQEILQKERDGRVSFFKCDILGGNASDVVINGCGADEMGGVAGGFDVIVSNPPYVCENEKGQMRPNVLDFEPSLALFVPDDNPLLFYKRISELSTLLLKEGGRLYFETNEQFAGEVVRYMGSCGFVGCRVVRDMFGKERMVCGVKKCGNGE